MNGVVGHFATDIGRVLELKGQGPKGGIGFGQGKGGKQAVVGGQWLNRHYKIRLYRQASANAVTVVLVSKKENHRTTKQNEVHGDNRVSKQ